MLHLEFLNLMLAGRLLFQGVPFGIDPARTVSIFPVANGKKNVYSRSSTVCVAFVSL